MSITLSSIEAPHEYRVGSFLVRGGRVCRNTAPRVVSRRSWRRRTSPRVLVSAAFRVSSLPIIGPWSGLSSGFGPPAALLHSLSTTDSTGYLLVATPLMSVGGAVASGPSPVEHSTRVTRLKTPQLQRPHNNLLHLDRVSTITHSHAVLSSSPWRVWVVLRPAHQSFEFGGRSEGVIVEFVGTATAAAC